MVIARENIQSSALLILLFILFIGNCGSVPSKRFYTLVNSEEKAQNIELPPACFRPLIVASIETSPPYDSDKIAFRTDKFEIKYYNYRFWVTMPSDMIKKLLAKKIESKKIVQAVESFIHGPADHLALYGKLERLELIEESEKQKARLAMSFLLKESKTEKTVWSYNYDKTRIVRGEEFTDIIFALNSLYNDESDKMINALALFLSSYGKCGEEE
ncbi:MAG: hypothetical protein Kow0090_22010 [Myxococcota bacterium]